MLVAGIASVECGTHVVVAAIGGIAAAAPGVVAQARHAAAGSVGRQAALMVGEGVSRSHSL